jgi:hypothetical protein
LGKEWSGMLKTTRYIKQWGEGEELLESSHQQLISFRRLLQEVLEFLAVPH